GRHSLADGLSVAGLRTTRDGEGAAREICVVADGAAHGLDRTALVGAEIHAALWSGHSWRITRVLFSEDWNRKPQDRADRARKPLSRLVVESGQRKRDRSGCDHWARRVEAACSANTARLRSSDGEVGLARILASVRVLMPRAYLVVLWLAGWTAGWCQVITSI